MNNWKRNSDIKSAYRNNNNEQIQTQIMTQQWKNSSLHSRSLLSAYKTSGFLSVHIAFSLSILIYGTQHNINRLAEVIVSFMLEKKRFNCIITGIKEGTKAERFNKN